MYYDLRKKAAAVFERGGIARIWGAYLLGQTVDTGLRFLRKNYVMFQYNQTNIMNKMDVTLRWTQNIGDGSGQFLGLLSYSLGRHWEIFSSGIVHAGGGDSEFGSLVNYQLMLGLEFTF